MTWVAVAIGGSAVVGAVGSGIAGHAAQQGAEAAANVNKDQFATTNAQQQPYMQSGYGALNKLNYLLGISPQTASGSPINPRGTPQGIDPSSGYRIGAGGGISQMLPGGTGGVQGIDPSSGYRIGAGGGISQAIPFGGASNGFASGHDMRGTPNMTAGQGMGAVGGSGLPVGPSGGTPAGGDGYGSLTASFTPQDFLNNQDPGYGFELQQGTQAMRNAAGAGSGALSGAALKDLLGYSQGFARTGYNDAFNRFQTQQGNIYSRLSGLAQLGQSSASNVGSAGAQLAGQAGQALTAGGAQAGAGYAGIANNLAGGAQNYWLTQTPAGQKALGYGGV